jgi:NADH:ubiquinone oxidoreductase subunit E
VSTPERDVLRFDHGSRVPGWDDAADLRKEPASVPDPATTPVPDELRAEIEAAMGRYPDRRSAAIPALAAVQRRYGWCTPEGIEQAACVMRLTPAYLVAVATFYDMLQTTPKGAHDVYVCTNISCSLRGADALLAAIEEAAGDDDLFNVRAFECLGACDIAPMVSVDGVYIGPLETSDVQRLLDDIRGGGPVLADRQLRPRLSADPGANSREFPPAEPQPQVARAGATIPDRVVEFGAPMREGDAGEDQPPAGMAASATVGEQPMSADDATAADAPDETVEDAKDAHEKGQPGTNEETT